jgi:hypothetical protein
MVDHGREHGEAGVCCEKQHRQKKRRTSAGDRANEAPLVIPTPIDAPAVCVRPRGPSSLSGNRRAQRSGEDEARVAGAHADGNVKERSLQLVKTSLKPMYDSKQLGE